VASSAGIEPTAAAAAAAATERSHALGAACAIVGVLGFSFKAVLVKLAYAAGPVDTTTLLALRMAYSAPLFAVMAWWAGRAGGVRPLERRDWAMLLALGFVGYYLASLLDFLGLKYITVSLERLILFVYPTIVVLLSALVLHRPVTRRAMAALVVSYAGIAIAFFGDVRAGGDTTATLAGSALVFAGACSYAVYLVGASRSIARLGSLRFVAWAMLVSTLFVGTQFVVMRPLAALAVTPRVHLLSALMAVFSTVLPTWLIAESIRRLGASTASLIGTLGPVFTIGLGVLILDEPLAAPQIIGAALVLGGVALVTLRPGR
jgi:drug/metabolite transporter (DMT)-like permease